MSESPRFTPEEFLREHQANMQQHTPFVELPFFKWLKAQGRKPPQRLSEALFGYYEGHTIKGAFSPEEISNYDHIFKHFWWERHQRAKTRSRAAEAAGGETAGMGR